MVLVLSWQSEHQWYGENGRQGVGVVFTAMERLGREMDLTSRFPNVDNGAGAVITIVEKPWGQISGSKSRDGDGVLLNDERGVIGPGAWQIRVPPPKDGVIGVVAWHGGCQCWCSIGRAAVGGVMVIRGWLWVQSLRP